MDFEKLVKKAKNGNKKAFAILVDSEKEKMFKIAYTYVKNEDAALEIVHETIYKAFTSINQLKIPSYFSTWLTRILINTALSHIKKEKKQIYLEVENEIVEEGHESKTSSFVDLKQAIDQLQEKYKTVILLKYYKQYTVKEIAEVLDCPIGTVKTNLHRALEKIRSLLGEGYINE